MKKQFLLLFLLFCGLTTSFAQLNMTYVGDLGYNESLSDVWGWTDTDGTEYALVGTRGTFSIVSLADPSNPQEVASIPGQNTTWRDIKTWDHYAYVISDATDEGLLIVNLENLPNLTDDDWYYWKPVYNDIGGVHESSHNLWIDEFGTMYLCGGNLNNGGVLYFDVATDSWNPVLEGYGPPIYSHDVFARDNKLYASEIYAGEFTIYDVSNLANPVTLGSQQTAADFTHNAWLSDDNTILFTTDEVANAPVGAYDISDPSNIITLDQFRPVTTLGDGVIPHNAHVWDDYVIISYYTDGCIIVDGSRPENLIEVGNFDTYIPNNTGFNGAWGAYPYLPSGLVLVSDIGNGLYVLEPDYVRACWLEGKVTDADNGNNLVNVEVIIDSNQDNLANTGVDGRYATGQALAGTFDVTFTRSGYLSKTVSVDLVNGELTTLNVELETPQSYVVTGQVISVVDGSPIQGASILIQSNILDYTATSDASGNFTLNSVIGGSSYNVFAAKWGHLHAEDFFNLTEDQDLIIELEDGYQDDFFVDLGWAVTGNAATGTWERGEPVGTFSGGDPSNPDNDVPGDIGVDCYVTGNGGGGVGDDDVDDGQTVLTSPVMELESTYNEPVISFYHWFYNESGFNTPNDQLDIYVDNGTDQVLLITIDETQNSWTFFSDTLSNYLEVTDDMTISLRTSDLDGSGNLVEAAVDALLVTEGQEGEVVSTNTLFDGGLDLEVFPNPSASSFLINYKMDGISDGTITILNMVGQQLASYEVNEEGTLTIGNKWVSGVYFVKMTTANNEEKIIKLIKQ